MVLGSLALTWLGQVKWISFEDEEHHPGSNSVYFIIIEFYLSHHRHHSLFSCFLIIIGREPVRCGCNILCDCMIADLGAFPRARAMHMLVDILFPLFVHLGDG